MFFRTTCDLVFLQTENGCSRPVKLRSLFFPQPCCRHCCMRACRRTSLHWPATSQVRDGLSARPAAGICDAAVPNGLLLTGPQSFRDRNKRTLSRLFPAMTRGSTTSARNVGLPSSLTVDSASTSRKDIGNMPEVAESFTERAARCAPSNFGQQPAWLHTSTVQPSARECMMVQTSIPRLSLERMPRRGNQVQSSWGPGHSGLLLGRKRVLRSGTLAGHFGRRMLSISFCRSFLWPMRRSSPMPISSVTSAGEFDARDSPKHVRQKNPKPFVPFTLGIDCIASSMLEHPGLKAKTNHQKSLIWGP